MKINVDGREGEFRKLDSTPPPGSKAKSVMTLEATVEVKPQPLRTVRPLVHAVGDIPCLLPAEAQIVLIHLLGIFEEKQSVKEGTVGDLLFGCENANPPLPWALTFAGINQLARCGYVTFQAPDNEAMIGDEDKVLDAWIKYTSKLLDLVYGP